MKDPVLEMLEAQIGRMDRDQARLVQIQALVVQAVLLLLVGDGEEALDAGVRAADLAKEVETESKHPALLAILDDLDGLFVEAGVLPPRDFRFAVAGADA